MPEAARDTVYIGQANPPGWGERARRAEASAKRAGRFVKEKIIDPHTPQAHTQESMRFFDEATSHLYGRSREIADALRHKVEVLATVGGWSKTMMELCLAGTAVGVSAVLVGKGVKSTVEVFRNMARRHDSSVVSTLPSETVPLLPVEERKESWVDRYRKKYTRMRRFQPPREYADPRLPNHFPLQNPTIRIPAT